MKNAPVYRVSKGLAARGIPVFPCRANAKQPLTPHGFRDALTDEGVIGIWERCWPSANLGIPTGLRSGLLVIDVDRKGDRNGFESLAALEAELGPLPPTLVSSTPHEGEHRWFAMPPETIRNAPGKLPGLGVGSAGIDVRAEGGYVLVPPSVIDERSYAWTTRAPVAELPRGWINALKAPDCPTAAVEPREGSEPGAHTRVEAWCLRALQQEARGLAATHRGARNDRLWRAAASLGGLIHVGVFNVEEARRALTWACHSWGVRDPRQDADTLERGLAFGLANPRHVATEGQHAP